MACCVNPACTDHVKTHARWQHVCLVLKLSSELLVGRAEPFEFLPGTRAAVFCTANFSCAWGCLLEYQWCFNEDFRFLNRRSSILCILFWGITAIIQIACAVHFLVFRGPHNEALSDQVRNTVSGDQAWHFMPLLKRQCLLRGAKIGYTIWEIQFLLRDLQASEIKFCVCMCHRDRSAI